MPQDSLRSVVYRSFVTCDDPKGVAESKTIIKSKKKEQKSKKTSPSSSEKELQLQSLSCLQVMEVSRGAAKLNQVIGSLSSNRPSVDTTSDLLRGALDLQDSLLMLGKLQEASKFISNSAKKKHKEKKKSEFNDLISFRDDFEKPRISSASRDCYDELREVIRESFARQNLLPKAEEERGVCNDDVDDADRKHTEMCVDLPSSSSSSSLIYSHSSSCSPSSIRYEKTKGSSNLIAKLMGLEEAPSRAANGAILKQMEKERVPFRRSPLLDIDHLPTRPQKPRFMVQKAVREKRTLQEIIETMQFKGILERKCGDNGSIDCNASVLRKDLAGEGPPIVIMRPLRGGGGRDEEPRDHHCINGGEHMIKKRRQMPRKMREEFPPKPPLKKSTAEKPSKQKLLDRGEEGKNLEKVRVRPVKKALDCQDRVSRTKMNQSKPEMQKKDTKVAPNARKGAEAKDAKPQRSDKTQELAKHATLKYSRTVRENNVSKTQIARGRVAAADRSMKPASLNPAVPRKNPRKGESNSKPSSALVENTQSDGNFTINIETVISESLVKNTEPEQTTEEVDKVYYISDNSRNEATSLSDPSGLIANDDSNHIEDDSSIPSFDSDQIKCCKSIMNTRYFLLSSVSFLNHIEELFDTGAHDSSTLFQTARLPDSEVLHDSLLLDCAKEILEHKSLLCRSMRNQWSQNLLRRPKYHSSMEQLVEEISDSIEGLQNYGKSRGEMVLADSIYPMLERDLCWNEEVTGGWDSGWRKGYAMEAVDEVMHDVEELVLSEIVADVIIEIMY